ncbi:hypothetical protein OBA41_02335 [Pelagibacteraceae bacterium]|nr:hypothetical protein [Pelagibacteraceae bacterium]
MELYLGDYSSPIVEDAELIDYFTINADNERGVIKYLLKHNIKIKEIPNDKQTT